MLIKHTAYYLLARGFPALVNFLAISVYTRLLSPEEYGRYAVLIAAVGLFNVVFFQWLKFPLLRFLPAQGDKSKKFLANILVGFFVLVIFSGLIGLLLACLWPNKVWRDLIFFSIPLLWAQAWFEINLELSRSNLRPSLYGLMSVIKTISALSVGSYAVILGFGVYGPLTGLFIGMLLGSLVGRSAWKGVLLKASRRTISKFLQYGLPLTASFVLAFFISSSDRFMITFFLGESETGIYSAAYDLSFHAINVISWIIGLATTPIVFRAYENGGTEKAIYQMIKNSRLMSLFLVPSGVVLMALAQDFSTQLLGVQFQNSAASIVTIVALSAILHGLRNHHFDLAFQLKEKTIMQFWIMVISGAINVGLNLILIPKMGMIAAAWTTLISYFVALVLSILLGNKIMQIPYDLKFLLKIFPLLILLWFVPNKWGGIGETFILLEKLFLCFTIYSGYILIFFRRDIEFGKIRDFWRNSKWKKKTEEL